MHLKLAIINAIVEIAEADAFQMMRAFGAFQGRTREQ